VITNQTRFFGLPALRLIQFDLGVFVFLASEHEPIVGSYHEPSKLVIA
jgi:hypothetical protein